MKIDLESRSEISNYSLEELEQFRDEKGFIDLSRAGVKFSDATREFVGNQERTKNWVTFNGVQTLIKGEAKLEEGKPNYGIYAELIIEELSKIYGIPAAHYDLVKMQNDDGNEELGVLSVSVVDKTQGEYLESLASLTGMEVSEDDEFDTTTSYEFTIEKLRERMEKNGVAEEEIERQLTELRKRLAYYMIIADADRHPENIAFVRHEDGSMEISPVFDSEAALLMDSDVETIKKLSQSVGNIIENSAWIDPRIATNNSSEENSQSPWKDTFQELLKDDEVRKYCLETLIPFKEEEDIAEFYDRAIQNVEKRIGAKIPEEARMVSKMLYMYRVKEGAQLLDKKIEVDRFTGGYFSERFIGRSVKKSSKDDIISNIVSRGTGKEHVGVTDLLASLQSMGLLKNRPSSEQDFEDSEK